MQPQPASPKKSTKKKRKKRLRIDRLLIVLSPLLVIPLLIWLCVAYFNPLALKATDYTVQYQQETFSPLDNVKHLYFGDKNDIQVQGSVDSSKPGDYAMVYSWKGKDYPFVVTVADTEGPDLTVKDVKTDTIVDVSAETFISEVSDEADYTVSFSNPDDNKMAGTYNVTITATDSYGNTTTKNARLTRVNDTEAPVIDAFTESATMLQGDTFKEEKFTAEDNIDPNPKVSVDTSEVDTNKPGTYDVTYTCTDRSGNNNVYTQQLTVEANPDYGKKIAYFTFDDGPSSNTEAVLDALDQYDAKATFFVTGLNPDYYDMMKEIVDRGHTIALHTYGHDYANVYSSEENYFADLQKISDLVEQETGVVADCIRFPGGSSNTVSADYSQGIMTALTQDVQDKGYQYFDWNADSTDASGINVPASTIVANATSSIGMDKVNLLFHDANGKETTVEALPEILKAYSDAGYVFRGVTSTGFAPHHDVNN